MDEILGKERVSLIIIWFNRETSVLSKILDSHSSNSSSSIIRRESPDNSIWLAVFSLQRSNLDRLCAILTCKLQVAIQNIFHGSVDITVYWWYSATVKYYNEDIWKVSSMINFKIHPLRFLRQFPIVSKMSCITDPLFTFSWRNLDWWILNVPGRKTEYWLVLVLALLWKIKTHHRGLFDSVSPWLSLYELFS